MDPDKPNFFTYVFKFDEMTRNELLNIGQYVVLAAIMVTLLLKGMALYFPKLDDKKDTFIVTAEIVAELAIIFVGILLIHRVIDFIPTMSGVPYLTQNIITIILPFLFIVLNTHTSVADKGAVVSNRIMGVSTSTKPNVQTNVRVSQPLAGNQGPPSLLPQGLNVTQNPMNQTPQPPIPEPDFNSMFAPPPNSGNAEMLNEPQAANSFVSGGFSY